MLKDGHDGNLKVNSKLIGSENDFHLPELRNWRKRPGCKHRNICLEYDIRASTHLSKESGPHRAEGNHYRGGFQGRGVTSMLRVLRRCPRRALLSATTTGNGPCALVLPSFHPPSPDVPALRTK